ncbi:YhcB family protein [Actinobacillus sp. GY-402]|nr:YhcB family protein [Actinobacillus sp. GY-402]
MQTWTTEMWLAAGIGLAVGIVITYLILRLTKGSIKKQAQTESELQQTKSALQKQEELLEKHFAESADLFKVLAQDYQKIYRHMAKSSDELMPDAKTKGLFLQSFMNSDKSTAAVEKDHQPRDYSEGSSGLFKAER